MKIMRNPKVNAAIILIITAFYSPVFILTSGHIEFERMLNHAGTLNNAFWNAWSTFLMQGNLKYIGYAYLVLAVAVVILSLIRKQNYDEYQIGILEKGFIVSGIVMVCLFPAALLLVLSDPYYAIEALTLLVVMHWSTVLIADLAYVIKWGKA